MSETVNFRIFKIKRNINSRALCPASGPDLLTFAAGYIPGRKLFGSVRDPGLPVLWFGESPTEDGGGDGWGSSVCVRLS